MDSTTKSFSQSNIVKGGFGFVRNNDSFGSAHLPPVTKLVNKLKLLIFALAFCDFDGHWTQEGVYTILISLSLITSCLHLFHPSGFHATHPTYNNNHNQQLSPHTSHLGALPHLCVSMYFRS